jgi:hypothetical protein
MVSILLVMLVVFAAVGWSLRPPPTGFPQVPEALSMQLTAKGIQSMTERLVLRTDGRVRLIVKSDEDPPGATTLSIYNIGSGHVCTPKQVVTQNLDAITIKETPAFKVKQIRNQLGYGGPTSWTDVDSVGPGVDVYICWRRDAPVRVSGAYLSAQFPPISLVYDYLQRVDSVLILKGANTADYSIQSPVSPLATDATSWSWAQAASAQSIHLSAIDVSTSQHENYESFLSGIAFGIAGGALITLLQELVAPLSRRKDQRSVN